MSKEKLLQTRQALLTECAEREQQDKLLFLPINITERLYSDGYRPPSIHIINNDGSLGKQICVWIEVQLPPTTHFAESTDTVMLTQQVAALRVALAASLEEAIESALRSGAVWEAEVPASLVGNYCDLEIGEWFITNYSGPKHLEQKVPTCLFDNWRSANLVVSGTGQPGSCGGLCPVMRVDEPHIGQIQHILRMNKEGNAAIEQIKTLTSEMLTEIRHEYKLESDLDVDLPVIPSASLDELIKIYADLPVEQRIPTLHRDMEGGVAAGEIIAVQEPGGRLEIRYISVENAKLKQVAAALSLKELEGIHQQIEQRNAAELN